MWFGLKPMTLAITRFLVQQAASEVGPVTGTRRFQCKIANRELNEMRDYHWVNEADIEATRYPSDVLVLARVGYSDFYDFVADVMTPGTQRSTGGKPRKFAV